jgi:hypothetical protein
MNGNVIIEWEECGERMGKQSLKDPSAYEHL